MALPALEFIVRFCIQSCATLFYFEQASSLPFVKLNPLFRHTLGNLYNIRKLNKHALPKAIALKSTSFILNLETTLLHRFFSLFQPE